MRKRIGIKMLPATGLALFLVAMSSGQARKTPAATFPPIDPQQVQDQDTMTWADYRPIPGVDWADPSIKPRRGFKLAVVGIDFPGQPFVITLPKGSDPFGNPQIDPVPRDEVPRFYADFFMKPGAVNHGHTINGYWMEQSRGRFGITDVEVFGPYRMPKPIWAYGLNEYGQNDQTPDGSRAAQGSPWELRINCPTGLLNHDAFVYWPTGNYPEHLYGGKTEPVGKWVYIHS